MEWGYIIDLSNFIFGRFKMIFIGRKRFFVFLLVFIYLLLSQVIFATENHISVPLNHNVYNILKNVEIRGLVHSLPKVKPYPTSTLINILKELDTSNQLTKIERDEIKLLLEEFTFEQKDNSVKSILQNGSYFTHLEKLNIGTKFGIKLNFQYGQSINNFSEIDSRNGGEIYLSSNISNYVSIFMNIGLRFDHLNHNLFMKNDFDIPSKGKYDTFWDHDGNHLLYYGIYATPEVSSSLMNGKLNIRFASIERDWGVATNNLMISGSANSFNAFEFTIEPSSWLNYSFIAGSLGKFYINDSILDNSDNFYSDYFFSDKLHERKYENNITAHRVEINLPFNLKFGIYESVIYKRRFEFGYLNPFSILMYEQNIMGDLDNMLAGFDLQWTLPKYFRAYIVAATTEMNEINPKRFFIAPRNVMGLQAGVDINIPLLSFTTATVQYTYLAPFFYTHIPDFDEEWNIVSELTFVNEGRNIGYPLRPSSDELLVNVNFNLKNKWDGSLTLKYQRRSGQYGWNIDKFMSYAAAKNDEYSDKNFNNYIFEKSVGIVATINKTMKNYPLKFSASYIINMSTERVNDPEPIKAWDLENGGLNNTHLNESDYPKYPVIEYEVSGPWTSWRVNNALRIGINIWL